MTTVFVAKICFDKMTFDMVPIGRVRDNKAPIWENRNARRAVEKRRPKSLQCILRFENCPYTICVHVTRKYFRVHTFRHDILDLALQRLPASTKMLNDH